MAANKDDKSNHLIQACKIDGSVSLDLSQLNVTRISDELLSLDHVEVSLTFAHISKLLSELC